MILNIHGNKFAININDKGWKNKMKKVNKLRKEIQYELDHLSTYDEGRIDRIEVDEEFTTYRIKMHKVETNENPFY